jgi:transposase
VALSDVPHFVSLVESRACYSCKLRQWISFFPRDKLHILQYEAMTSQDAMQGVLANFKTFLGVDQRLPSDNLPLTNWKHQRGGPDEVHANPQLHCPCGLLFWCCCGAI